MSSTNTIILLFVVVFVSIVGGFSSLDDNSSPVLLSCFVIILIIFMLFTIYTWGISFKYKILFIFTYFVLPLSYSVIFFTYSSIGPCIYISGSDLNYWDHLYFSTITLTGLGYADLYPIGHCKYLAMSEAFFGFAFLPVVISLAVSDILRK
jgi:hypothetical protein